MNLVNIGIVAVSCSFFAIILTGIVSLFILRDFIKELKLNRKNKEIKNSLEMNEGKNLNAILDNLIEESINTYVILILGFLEVEHIPEKEEKKMIEHVYTDVILKMSPLFRNALSLIYDREYINKEIKRRVTLAIMSYVINTNGNFKK